jgi:two-component system NtrC family response regulator
VVVDCTTLPETLVESVLFGHERGAFTGADRSHEGLIKQADGGTLFLDEIGELPFLIQKRSLWVIMPIEPDSIAVLSASNREELQQMQLLRGLLTEIYVIVVIPDRKDSTIRLAHLLLPRFLSQKESDFTDLKIVLNKMYCTSH